MPGKKYKYYITVVQKSGSFDCSLENKVWVRVSPVPIEHHEHLEIIEISEDFYKFLIQFNWMVPTADNISQAHRIKYD